MSAFTFTFPVTTSSGKPAPNDAALTTAQNFLDGNLGENTNVTTLTFSGGEGNMGTITVTGTTDDLETVKKEAANAVDDLAPIGGWVAGGQPTFASGGRRRRRRGRKSVRRGRKGRHTRRH